MDLKKIAVVAAVILLVLLVVLCVIFAQERESNYTTSPTTQSPTQPTGTTSGNTENVPEYSVCVSTAYGRLFYQDQWIDFMQVEQSQEGDVITVVFQGSVNEQKYKLFTLTIGAQSGSPIGTITDDSGVTRNVCAQMHELGDLSGLSEGEKNRLYAMQEDINFVIANLK